MSAHTKGQWQVFQRLGDWDIWAPATPCIARVMLRDVSINEQKANAQLIAAAPVMLEALQDVCGTLSGDKAWHGSDTLAQLEAAIAAATGEA